MAGPASFGTERRNPLPAGRYWVFRNNPEDIVEFDAWLKKWRMAGMLRVLSSELGAGPGNVPFAFVVWEVLRPDTVIWDQPGLPDRAAPHVTSHQDVTSSPRVKEPLDQLSDAANAVTRAGEQLPVLVFIGALLYLYSTRRD